MYIINTKNVRFHKKKHWCFVFNKHRCIPELQKKIQHAIEQCNEEACKKVITNITEKINSLRSNERRHLSDFVFHNLIGRYI